MYSEKREKLRIFCVIFSFSVIYCDNPSPPRLFLTGYVTEQKRITKTKNQIISKNYLLINNNEKKEVEFNEIESIYNIDEKIIICPKGKYHPIEYYKNNFEEKIPLNFKENGNWNLKCYQSEVGKIQAYYLMNGKNILYTITKNEYILDQHNKLFDLSA